MAKKSILKTVACLLFVLSTPQLHAIVPFVVFAEVDPQDETIGWRQSFDIDELIYEGKSPFQDIVIFNHKKFGRILALDNVIQTTEADEFIYHEMLNQIPMLAHPNPKNVLIIGGGDGGSLREVLRHQTVEKVTMVDLDGLVVQLCQQYLPKLSSGAFNDPRVELFIGDGVEFVKNSREKYDVIICDSTDPVGPGKVLFSQEFYSDCKNILSENGILATHNGLPFTDGLNTTESYQALTPSFTSVRYYVAPIPTYMGGFMCFTFATNDLSNTSRSTEYLQERNKTLKGNMRYYTPELHNAAFVLPQYILDYIPEAAP